MAGYMFTIEVPYCGRLLHYSVNDVSKDTEPEIIIGLSDGSYLAITLVSAGLTPDKYRYIAEYGCCAGLYDMSTRSKHIGVPLKFSCDNVNDLTEYLAEQLRQLSRFDTFPTEDKPVID